MTTKNKEGQIQYHTISQIKRIDIAIRIVFYSCFFIQIILAVFIALVKRNFGSIEVLFIMIATIMLTCFINISADMLKQAKKSIK